MTITEQRPTQTGHKQLYRQDVMCNRCHRMREFAYRRGQWRCRFCGWISGWNVWVWG